MIVVKAIVNGTYIHIHPKEVERTIMPNELKQLMLEQLDRSDLTSHFR